MERRGSDIKLDMLLGKLRKSEKMKDEGFMRGGKQSLN
jgi:hypothetical protein